MRDNLFLLGIFTLVWPGCVALLEPDDDDDDDDGGCNVDEVWPVDFEALCAGDPWPSDEGVDGWADSPVEQRYGDGFAERYREVSGLTDEEMDCHVRLRNVHTHQAQQSSGTDVSYQFDIGWVRIVEGTYVSAEGGDPTENEIAAAWDEWGNALRIDLDAPFMAYADAQAYVDECAAEHGVTFPSTGWCSPWVPDFANDDDDDELGIRYDFSEFLPGDDGWLAIASVDVTGVEEPRCRTTQIAGEP